MFRLAEIKYARGMRQHEPVEVRDAA
jgi:hypothetical protein